MRRPRRSRRDSGGERGGGGGGFSRSEKLFLVTFGVLCLQRPPTSTERAAAEKFLAQCGKTAFCSAQLNSNALILVE